MIRSMTGYGRAESAFGGKTLTVEIKSLNHRNLETSVRLPAFLAPLEINIKKKVGERVARGRVEVNVRIDSDPGANGADTLEANIPLLKSYYALLTSLKESFHLTDEITLNTLVRLKGGIYTSELEIDPEEVWDTMKGALDHSIDSLEQMKEVEGRLLYDDFTARLDTVTTGIETLKARVPEVIKQYQERLSTRIRELANGMECDESRLIQEVAIMAEKSDITEEIVRLESHVKQFGTMLDSDEAIGRKMDFLLQEMHREINTIGSKSNDLAISGTVIEIKTELAKLREQVQNIE
ncbi:MAG: YicC family protein [Deltaproteobacteria bacterium]|nr:YicC family protein [Deltaproteobacteria bacterium]